MPEDLETLSTADLRRLMGQILEILMSRGVYQLPKPPVTDAEKNAAVREWLHDRLW